MGAEKGSLRELMPQTAQFVDELRRKWSPEATDKVMKAGRAGKGGFYVAEIGPDGVFREFGSLSNGRRCEAREGKVVWLDGKA